MKKVFWETAPRLILGTLFLISAIDGFWFIFSGAHLIHPPTSERGLQFEQALIASGFFWPFLKTVSLIGALCLLINRAPAFGLALIAPVMAVIVLFHLVLNPQGIPVAIVLTVCGLLLVRTYAANYAGLFRRSVVEYGGAADASRAAQR
jgi:hypothetical protein